MWLSLQNCIYSLINLRVILKSHPWAFQYSHSLSAAVLVRIAVDPEPILWTLGLRLIYILGGTPVHHRAPSTHIHMHISTLIHSKGQFILSNPLTGKFLVDGRKPENTVETPLHTENMLRNSTQTVTRAQNQTREPWFSITFITK